MEMWESIISAASTPIGFFVTAILVCNAVFTVCATALKNNEMFKYSIHMFLGIVFFFGIILLWSPGSLYPPEYVDKFKLVHKPWVPTVSVIFGSLVYGLYQAWKIRQGR